MLTQTFEPLRAPDDASAYFHYQPFGGYMVFWSDGPSASYWMVVTIWRDEE